ncbi:MAG: hypothetical protein KF812_04180 [Fimbriimonadaceae bacterium]|nr:hypothetical protein [Fimbriimonadaceae bacterium]
MSTPQQNHDQGQARIVISGVFLLGLAGMAFAAYFLQNVAGDHKLEAGHSSEHGAPTHEGNSHGEADSHGATNEHGGTDVSHTAITAQEFDINDPEGAVAPGDVTVSGTGTPGNTVTVTANGKEVKATVGEDGTWSAPFEFAPGEVKVTAADGKHPASEVTYIVLAPDTDGPTLGISNLTEGARIKAEPLELKGTARPGELVRISRDGNVLGEAKANDQGEWSFTVDGDSTKAKEFRAISLGDNASVTIRVNP